MQAMSCGCCRCSRLLAAVLAYPLASGLLLSLRRTTGSTEGEYVGLDNYIEALFRDDIFHQAVGNTVAFTAVAIVLQTGVGLLLAILISELRRSRLPYRMMFFAPVVLSAVAVGSVWKWIYAPYFGLLANVAATVGLGDVYSSLLSSQATALWAIMGAFVWRWAGFNTVIYLAGQQSISREYYEAAMIEGAGGVRRFVHITWPLLLPYTYTVVLLTTMGTLRIFDMMWIMTQGGPAARDRDGRHIHLHDRVPLPTRRVRAIAGPYSVGPGGAVDVGLDSHAAQARERERNFGMSRLMRGDTRVQILLHGLLVCLFVIWAYPVVWTLTSSLKANGDLYSVPWSLPDPAHFENMTRAWVQGQLGQAFLNSAYVTAVSVSLILFFAVPAAFGFARLRLPFPAVLGLAILVPLMIPSEVILVQLFVMFARSDC